MRIHQNHWAGIVGCVLCLVTEASYGDCLRELEFLVAKHSNSGVKLMIIHEIQMLDRFGKAALAKEEFESRS